jgi:DNA-binding transcriptional MerR regulator
MDELGTIVDMERFNIKAIVKYSGVNAHTLRAWERRYQVIRPSREPNGRRMYSLEDAERLKLLATLVSEGHAISHLAKLTDDDLRSLIARTKGEAALPARSKRLDSTLEGKSLSADSNRIQSLVDDGNIERIHDDLGRIRRAVSPRMFVLAVTSPLIQKITSSESKGLLSSAQAEALSIILRLHLSELLESMRSSAPTSPLRFAVVGVGGYTNPNTLMQAAVLCAARGHGCWWLGNGLSVAATADTAHALKANVLITDSGELPVLGELDRVLPSVMAIWTMWPESRGSVENGQALTATRQTTTIASLENLDRKLG